MSFGLYLKKLREENKVSQRLLAEKAGISNTEISRIESGESQKPSPSILKSIAPFLGVGYEELMVKAGYMEESIEHSGYTELVYRDSDGNLADIIRKAKEMEKNDSDWANIAYRVSSELSPQDLSTIKAVANALLEKNKNK
jgi:transcriptional regulator with XRE-family HTH domain